MNKKLEKYRDEAIKKTDFDGWAARPYIEGFRDAIILDLSVKFATWFESTDKTYKEWARTNYCFGRANRVKEGYEYWVENILKLE
jgi:hypothetical protein